MRFSTASLLVACAVGLLIFPVWFDANGRRPTRLHAQQSVPPKSDKDTKSQSRDEKPTRDADELTLRKLEEEIEKIELVEATLADFFSYFEKEFDLQFYIDRMAFVDADIPLDRPEITIRLRHVPVEMVLRRVLGELDLDYSLDHGVLIISTVNVSSQPDNLLVRVYPVGDLVEPLKRSRPKPRGGFYLRPSSEPSRAGAAHGAANSSPNTTSPDSRKSGGAEPGELGNGGPDSTETASGNARSAQTNEAVSYDVLRLMEVIRTTCDPDSWEENGGTGRMTEFRGALIVAHTWRHQRLVKQFLDDLRSAVDPSSD